MDDVLGGVKATSPEKNETGKRGEKKRELKMEEREDEIRKKIKIVF